MEAWSASGSSSGDIDGHAFSVPNNGQEDHAVTLSKMNIALTDTDGSETLVVKLSGFPAGATFSVGAAGDNGTWIISDPAQIAALNTTPLTMTPPANWNGHFTLSVTATVTDTATLTDGVHTDTQSWTQTIDVGVQGVNDAPAGADSTATINEDTSLVLTAGQFGFSDVNDNPANTLAAVKITTLPGAGSLTLNGAAVTAGQFIDIADINAGHLVFTPAANANGNGYASLTFQVQDNGSGSNLDLSPNTLTHQCGRGQRRTYDHRTGRRKHSRGHAIRLLGGERDFTRRRRR